MSTWYLARASMASFRPVGDGQTPDGDGGDLRTVELHPLHGDSESSLAEGPVARKPARSRFAGLLLLAMGTFIALVLSAAAMRRIRCVCSVSGV